MKRWATLVLLALWAIVGLAGMGTAQDQDSKGSDTKAKMSSAKAARWHGTIVRSNKDDSTLTVRRQNVERKVHYDGSTKWTRLNKPADMSEFKDGADVICLGNYDEKGELHATRIDLRRE
jgi:hypothetical protein